MVKIMCECEYECDCERKMKAKMREKIMEYAGMGDTTGLYSTIKEDPEILQDIDKIQFVNTPLHEAAAAGKTSFAIEIMNLMPSFGKKLNPEGLSPLHLALEAGHTETAHALVRIDKQLVRVKGKEGQTPLHCAAKIPDHDDHRPKIRDDRLDLLAGFLLACPDSIDVLNNRLQTAVHVALENCNCDATSLLVRWLIRRSRESVLSWKDDKGNTALHTAAQHGCRTDQGGALKKLVKLVKINKKNSDGDTPLDIAESYGQTDVKQVLIKARAKRGKDLPEKQSSLEYLSKPIGCFQDIAEYWIRAYYFLIKTLTLDMRNTILLVAVLIVTATYQGVLQPPGGVYQAEGNATTTTGSRISGRQMIGVPLFRLSHLQRRLSEARMPGHMVMGKNYYGYFMPSNTFAFTLSIVIIMFMLPSDPFFALLHFCLMFMCLSYLLALRFISESLSLSYIIFILSWYALIGAGLVKLLYFPLKAIFDDEDWWLRRLGVWIANRFQPSKGQKLENIVDFANAMRKQYKILASK